MEREKKRLLEGQGYVSRCAVVSALLLGIGEEVLAEMPRITLDTAVGVLRWTLLSE